MCVTEQRDANNLPTMFYTPNPDKYTESIPVAGAGVGQKLADAYFALSDVRCYELFQNHGLYYPLIISVNYSLG